MTSGDWVQAVATAILVVVTAIYAWRTFAISNSSEKQANASVKMAEEMKEQRLVALQPITFIRPVHQREILEETSSDYFSHFEVYNAGNGPAIEIEVSLLNQGYDPLDCYRETFLRAGQQTNVDFSSLYGREESSLYIVCEYRRLFSDNAERTCDQAWLPFKVIKGSRGIYVQAGELEHRFEIPEKDRINAFKSESKPK